MKPVTPVILRPGIGDDLPTATLYYGQDVRETLRSLPEASIHTVCTSPPYWGLRDYGVDGQIGLEPTPEGFVAELVDVFREVKRVLRPDGTLWVNLGDSYVSTPRGNKNGWEGSGLNGAGGSEYQSTLNAGTARSMDKTKVVGLKQKDLVGIPWRVAFALQADGWYLRSDIVWAKGSCMPESVTDRPTKAHEYVFLFAHPDSGGKYYYDIEAVKEPAVKGSSGSFFNKGKTAIHQMGRSSNTDRVEDGNRNKRSVWNVNPKPYTGSHFAVWPPDLVRPMILAGCPVGGTVLDPFSGSATTGMVALQEGRNYIGTDLNPDYLPMAEARVREERPPAPSPESDDDDVLGMFGGAE